MSDKCLSAARRSTPQDEKDREQPERDFDPWELWPDHGEPRDKQGNAQRDPVPSRHRRILAEHEWPGDSKCGTATGPSARATQGGDRPLSVFEPLISGRSMIRLAERYDVLPSQLCDSLAVFPQQDFIRGGDLP